MTDLQRVAPMLRELTLDPGARVFYDLLAGGLVWSDELPPLRQGSDGESVAWALRGVWHYRTSVILGTPAGDCKPAWEDAQKLFPAWPGFDPGRRDPLLAPKVKELQAAGDQWWTEWDEKLRESQPRQPKQATA